MPMKKTLTIILLVLLNSAYSQNVKLTSKPVCIDNFDNIAELDKIFSSSCIILLGEAGHGDGATFELKTKLIKYLYEKHNYTILINEASGFIETVNMNQEQVIPSQIFEKTADTKFSLSEQYKGLKLFLAENPSFKYYGLDCQPLNVELFLNNLNNLLNRTSNSSVKAYLANVISYYEQATSRKEFVLTLDDLKALDSITVSYSNNLKIFNHTDDIYIKQLLLNIQANVHIAIHNIEEMSYSYKSINWRDSVMALNVDYIVNKFPNKKVIISAANFHNAKSIHKIYRNEDSTYYAKIQPCGWHIANNYKDKAYSIAIASTSGTFGYCTDTSVYNITEVAKFKIDENVLETHLLIPNCEISFYDFRNDKALETQVYRSLIFGTNMHRGKWSTAFDGVINIKNQKASIPIKIE